MDKTGAPIQTFDAMAAIREYLQNPPDWEEAARQAVQKAARDLSDPTKLTYDATRNIESFVSPMRQLSETVDPKYRTQALRMVEANKDWIAADEKKDAARRIKDEKAAHKQQRKQDRLSREIQTFQLFQSIKESTQGTAGILTEMKAAREDADEAQEKQATFNKWMTIVAVLLAAGSLVMPFVQEFVWKDPPSKPEVVVVQESDLTVPPLLRRLGP